MCVPCIHQQNTIATILQDYEGHLVAVLNLKLSRDHSNTSCPNELCLYGYVIENTFCYADFINETLFFILIVLRFSFPVCVNSSLSVMVICEIIHVFYEAATYFLMNYNEQFEQLFFLQ